MTRSPVNTEGDSRAAERVRENLERLLHEVEEACERSGRNPRDVTVLPITKYVEPTVVRFLYQAGVREFGESTVQESIRKREALFDLHDMRCHMVGHLQRNKVPRALSLFDAIHSLDSFRLAEALDRRIRSAGGSCPHLFVEVNLAGESSKSGLPFEEALACLERIQNETTLGSALIGLMGMAPIMEDPQEARPLFRKLRELRDRAVEKALLPEGAGLSMGMSNDFPAAVVEGATMLRIGSRFFEGLPSQYRRNR